jgi:sugar phosphate isomerase/epimerase
MHYGMPTLIELQGLEENMRFCKSLGLDFVELNMNVPEYQIEALNKIDTANLKRKYGVDLTMHLPENLYFADFNTYMRKAAFDIFKDAAEFAVKNDVKLMNMHMHVGTFFKMPNEKVFLQGAYKETFLKHVEEFRAHIDFCLQDTDLKVCIENACDFHYDFIKEAVKILLESEHVYLTWDTGHNAKGKYKDQVLLFEDTKNIKHVHLHDCAFGNDHLPLGTGEICIDTVMNTLTDTCETIVLESKTIEGVRRSVIHLDVRNKQIAV